jgi:hypothetical protein
MHSRSDPGRTSQSFAEEAIMKKQFKLSGELMVAALLVGILALPVVGGTQTGSNASLDDTLNWLTSFLPTATGAKTSNGIFRVTSSIAVARGCAISIRMYQERFDVPTSTPDTRTEEFSLSDIDPATVTAGPVPSDGVFQVYGSTRGGLKAVKDGNYPNGPTSEWVIRAFADQASAQRVANALQHAAQLCANAQPF